MKKKFESIHFEHDEVVYVPCYQVNPTLADPNKGPTFRYSLSEASHDEQMVASMNPDYILVLRGKFDAKTQPFDMDVLGHNWKVVSQHSAYVPNFHALDDLTEKGFLRKVISPCGKLMLYNYTDKCTYNKKWTKHTLNSRGTVYEIGTGRIVARAFPKFFNFEELPASRARGILNKVADFETFEKMDGSLGIIYCYESLWRVNTRGSFTSDQAIKATEMLNKYDMTHIAGNLTLLTEIIYPENKIIVDYGEEEKLVLIGAYENYSGKELEWHELEHLAGHMGMELPKRYTFNSWQDLIDSQKSLPAEEEGYVVKFKASKNSERIKFKSKEYLKLARLMNYITPLHFWEHMKDGVIDQELLEQIPEELREISEGIRKELEKEYRDMRTAVYKEVGEVFEATKGSDNQKKAIGLLVNENKFKHGNVAFLIMDDKSDKIDSYIKKLIRPKGNEFVKNDSI